MAAAEEADELLACAGGDARRLDALVRRRLAGEPLAWITGGVRFCGRRLRVDPGVYVPRPHTELLARRAVERCPRDGLAVDLCTGCGAVAATLAAERPRARVLATDSDERAVACARRNGVDARLGDLDAPLPPGLAGAADVVVAVAPYVPTPELRLLQRDTFAFESAAAYDGGPDGTRLLRRVAAAGRRLLRPGGALLLELGGDQADAIAPELDRGGFDGIAPIVDEDGDLRGIEATHAVGRRGPVPEGPGPLRRTGKRSPGASAGFTLESRPEVSRVETTETCVIDPEALDGLIEGLQRRGYRVVGPTVREGAIVYADLSSAAQLPIGVTDVQEPGRYRLEQREDEARFGYAVGPHSWKQFLFPARLRLWSARRSEGAVTIEPEPPPDRPLALIGVRACELHGIAVQDRVFLGGPHVDDRYAVRREGAFVCAVNCFEPAGTCFCASMGTGPEVGPGYDLALTEVLDGGHRLVVRAGSERGAEVLAELPHRAATAADTAAAEAAVAGATRRMGRSVDADDLPGLLARNLEHARWDDVADRCLTCANCTLVCPTCFCSNVEDHTTLAGDWAERVRTWDSCFEVGHSYLHGGSIRTSSRSRYRQWLTHKFGTWHDQFGTSGCVGCGRCITWCPVGIDVTEELAALRATDGGGG